MYFPINPSSQQCTDSRGGGGGGGGVVFPIPQTLFILKAFKSPYFFKSPQIKFFNQGFPKEGVQRLEKIPNKSLTNLVKIFSVFF